jgi:hypothetical protein
MKNRYKYRDFSMNIPMQPLQKHRMGLGFNHK